MKTLCQTISDLLGTTVPGYATVAEVEAELGCSREELVALVNAGRRAQLVSLDAWDGRHGTIPRAAIEGGIREGGRLLTLLSLRD